MTDGTYPDVVYSVFHSNLGGELSQLILHQLKFFGQLWVRTFDFRAHERRRELSCIAETLNHVKKSCIFPHAQVNMAETDRLGMKEMLNCWS